MGRASTPASAPASSREGEGEEEEEESDEEGEEEGDGQFHSFHESEWGGQEERLLRRRSSGEGSYRV